MTTRRELLSSACALAATSLLPRTSWAAQAPSPAAAAADPMSFVNPEFRPAVEKMAQMMGSAPALNDTALSTWRGFMSGDGPPLAPSPAVTEHMIPGSPGAPQVRVYVTGESAGASKPAVLHIHGGGYIMGSARSERKSIQDLSIAHNCVAVTVDYRLAPETHFPGSLEDNYAALRWMHSNAKDLGIDVSRIAIKGESAGGGHAAALAIAARDRAEFPICLQVLIYPMLDDRTGSTNQLPPHFGYYVWKPEYNRYGWTALLGVPAGSATIPQNSVPARVSNLAGLAPAFIGVGSIDLFAPEDIDYAQRLIAAGVPTELSLVPGGFHGFDGIAADTTLSRQFNQAWNEALRRAFAKA